MTATGTGYVALTSISVKGLALRGLGSELVSSSSIREETSSIIGEGFIEPEAAPSSPGMQLQITLGKLFINNNCYMK